METSEGATNPSSSTRSSAYIFQEESGQTVREWERLPGKTPTLPQVTVPVPGPKNPNLKGNPGPSPAMVPSDAKVKIFVFSDFQCPNCMRVVEPMKYLARKYPKDVQIIFKQFPLPSHKNAFHAALATGAAARQGKFWELHDLLFKNMRSLGLENMVVYAAQAGLDIVQFKKDMEDPTLKDQVEYERDLAQKLGITGTPGIMVGDKQQVGWASYEAVDMMIKRALNSPPQQCTLDSYLC